MGLTAMRSSRALRQLLPPGRALTEEADSNLQRLLDGLGRELDRLNGRACDLLEEADPRRATELLGEWEDLLGLPDPCAGDVTSLGERRGAVLGRLTSVGTQSPAYYLALAAAYGEPRAVLEEFRPSVCGLAYCGTAHCAEPGVRFYWLLHLPETEVVFDRCGEAEVGIARCGRVPTADRLLCALAREAPAHTHYVIRYDLDEITVAYLVTLDAAGLQVRIAVENGRLPLLDSLSRLVEWVAAGSTLTALDSLGRAITFDLETPAE